MQVVSAATPEQAAVQWAAGLSSPSLDQAAGQIGSYPFAYRRAIMQALSPEGRSAVWQSAIAGYIQSHPDLSADALTALNAASALASPANLAAPTAAVRAQVQIVGAQVQAAIGRDDAVTLLYRLGPADGTFASLEPTSLKVSNWVRARINALAALNLCDCATDWGCAGLFLTCKANTGCQQVSDWPACGWLWEETCDGQCNSVFAG